MNGNEKLEKALDGLAAKWEDWSEVWSEYHDKAEEFWNSLTEEQREQAFYWVTSKIHEAEIANSSSYRTVLYDYFGFDPGAYVVGMESGYMSIHNALHDGSAMMEMEQANQLVITCDGEEVYASESGMTVEYEHNRFKGPSKVARINLKSIHKKVSNRLDL